jgi:hypothetical protein
MPGVGFEPTTPVSQRAKTIHALDSEATITGKGTDGFQIHEYIARVCKITLPNVSFRLNYI